MRNAITLVLESKEASNLEGIQLAQRVLSAVESCGLDLSEWYEDTDILRYVGEIVLKARELSASSRDIAMATLFILEDAGLSLDGNGWLDDDVEAREAIGAIYDAMIAECKPHESNKHRMVWDLIE